MGVWVRILLRYIAAALVAHGWFSQDEAALLLSDPELSAAFEIALGVVIAAAVEAWWRLAKRFGWST